MASPTSTLPERHQTRGHKAVRPLKLSERQQPEQSWLADLRLCCW